MNARPISYINTINKKEPDDLFMCCVSFEERCINSAKLLIDKYSAKKYLIVRYEAANEFKFREKHQKIILEHLYNHAFHREDVHLELFDKSNPYHFWKFLEEWTKENIPDTKNITIDITTFTKAYLLTLLKFLRERYPKATIRLIYTVGIYEEHSPLTVGIRDIIILPFLGNSSLSTNKTMLFLFLGYEGERAYSIWKHIEPTKTIAIIGNPPSYLGAERVSVKFNQVILEDFNTDEETVPALDPISSLKVLQKWYLRDEFKDYMFYISPLGTKMETVGIYLFFEKFQPNRAQVIYAFPGAYNEKKYTLKYEENRIWEFFIPKKGEI